MNTHCSYCHKAEPLIPFARVSPDPDHRYTESDFTMICSGCHFQHAQFRELKPERLPYWFIVAQRIRDFITRPPAPPSIPKKFNRQLQLI